MNPAIKTVHTFSITHESVSRNADVLVVEEPLEIRLAFGSGQGRRRISVAVTMRTPGQDEDLATGFLFTEGLIADSKSIMGHRWLDENVILVELQPDIYVDEERLVRHFFTSSSCGVCGKASLDAVRTVNVYYPAPGHPKVKPSVLFRLPETLRATQATFQSTGGLHAAGLFDLQGNLLDLTEDVGRHNAVDKLMGAVLRKGYSLPLRDYLVLVSGRAGFELVQKCAMAGIPFMAAVGAPSSLAVELAEASDMTLVGFLRDLRFNVYHGIERIDS